MAKYLVRDVTPIYYGSDPNRIYEIYRRFWFLKIWVGLLTERSPAGAIARWRKQRTYVYEG